MRTLTAVLLAAFLAATTAGVADAKATPITKLVPKDSVAVVGFPDLSALKKNIKTTNLWKMFDETELKDLVATARKSIEPQMKQAEEQLKEATGLTLKGICDLLDGELGVAVIEADPAKPAPRIMVSFGYDKAKHGAQVDKLLELLAKMMGVEKPETKKVGTATIVTLAGQGGPPISYTQLDGQLLLAIDTQSLEQAIAFKTAADGKGTLVENPRFLATMKACGVTDPSQVNFGLFVDLAPIWKTVDAQVKDAKVLKALEVFGLRDWTAMGFCNRIVDGQLVDAMHLATNGKARGVTRWIAPGAIAEGAHMDRVPKKAIAYQASRMGLGAMYTELLAGIKAVDEEAHGQVTEMIAGVEEQLGVKLADFLGSIGDHLVAHSTMPAEGGLMPRGITEIQITDAKAFLAGVEAIGKMLDLKLVNATYKGKTIYHLQAPVGELGKNPFEDMNPEDPMGFVKLMTMFLPTHFYIDGDWAVFGSLHQHLMDNIDVPAEARGVKVDMPAGTNMFVYSNAAPIFVGIYQGLLPFAGTFEGMARVFGVDFDARMLPRPSTLRKYLDAPTRWHCQRTEAGITMSFRDNIGLSPAAGIGFTAAMASAWLGFQSGGPMMPEDEPMRAQPEESNTKAKGDVAPDFTLTDAKGEKVTLSKLKGKVVVIDFWATWCGPCKQVMPHIQKLHEKYGKKNVVVLGVNVWDASEKAKGYMKEKGYTYSLLLSGDKVADAYGVTGIPSLFVVGKDGKIAHVKVGYDLNAEAELGKAIDIALAAK